MLFSEIYSSYYNAVAKILEMAAEQTLTGKKLNDAVMEQAFEESLIVIPDALKTDRWPLLTKDFRTPLYEKPTMPLTTLQKRWLKTLLLDPRIALFSPEADGLENVEPLYAPEMVVFFDRYEDGDPFTDREYIKHFQTVLKALRERRGLRIQYRIANGREKQINCVPIELEYSSRDDKFRLHYVLSENDATGKTLPGEKLTANVSRMLSVELGEKQEKRQEVLPPQDEELFLLLTDERGAMQRAMIAFSDFEKDAVKLDEKHYRIHLWYNRRDETDLLIRILSFGPMIRVTEPKELVDQIWARLRRQREYYI